MKITRIKLDDLILDPANVRQHDRRNIDAIKGSLTAFNQYKPIVVQAGTNKILCGNGTYHAAQELGVKALDAHVVEVDDVKAAALAIADNRTAELAEWDDADLAAMLDSLPDDILESTGFNQGELDAMIDRYTDLPDDIDRAPEPPDDPVTRKGDLLLLGDHRIVCGDCTSDAAFAKLEHKPTLLVTDPPYCSGGFQEAGRSAGSIGTTGEKRFIANDTLSTRGYMSLLRRMLETSAPGCVQIFTDWRQWVNLFDVVESSGFGVRAMVVWDKGSPGMGRGWRSQHELVMVASRVAQPFNPKSSQGNVVQADRTGNKHHATEKPVALMVKLLEVANYTDTVFDPFLGSGSTLLAAEHLGRTCYAMELDPTCVDVAVSRWEELTGKKAERVR